MPNIPLNTVGNGSPETPLLHSHSIGKSASISASVFNLIKSIVGAGVLALPFAISKLGIVIGLGYGITNMWAVICIQAYFWFWIDNRVEYHITD